MIKILSTIFFLSGLCWAQTSVNNGNWSNPATWGGTLPSTSGTIVIKHQVILDVDYGHFSGSITIDASAALVGNSSMRLFSINYPSGSTSLLVNGTLDVKRMVFHAGSSTINGNLQADSLLNSSTMNINANGKLNVGQFMNNTNGQINNAGEIKTINFLNIQTVTNQNIITANDFCNSKSFTNQVNGTIQVSHDFTNIDTLASPAIFTNNGTVSVGNDWYNNQQMNGNGKFCVAHNTWNNGSMTGTFDFCDQSGNDLDLNTGTIAAGITHCFNPCFLGNEKNNFENHVIMNISPNPFNQEAQVTTNKTLHNVHLVVFNSYGQKVQEMYPITGTNFILKRKNLENGMYFVQISQNGQILPVEKVIISD